MYFCPELQSSRRNGSRFSGRLRKDATDAQEADQDSKEQMKEDVDQSDCTPCTSLLRLLLLTCLLSVLRLVTPDRTLRPGIRPLVQVESLVQEKMI